MRLLLSQSFNQDLLRGSPFKIFNHERKNKIEKIP